MTETMPTTRVFIYLMKKTKYFSKCYSRNNTVFCIYAVRHVLVSTSF